MSNKKVNITAKSIPNSSLFGTSNECNTQLLGQQKQK